MEWRKAFQKRKKKPRKKKKTRKKQTNKNDPNQSWEEKEQLRRAYVLSILVCVLLKSFYLFFAEQNRARLQMKKVTFLLEL